MPVNYVNSSNSRSPLPSGGNGDLGSFEAARGAFNLKFKTPLRDNVKDMAPPPPAPAPPSPAPPPPPAPPADAGSADWQTFVAGNATGDAPPDLQPPPGTTAADIDKVDPGLLQNINKMKWNGAPEGDLFAQQHGFKDLNDMLTSKSPEAAKATAELAWDAKAANNATEADGAARPDAERNSNMLSGIRDGGEVDPGSTGAILQDKIVHSESINGKTTFASKRTYADGESISNATMVGNRIADVFKEILQVICPPMADLIQMAQDGATKVRDEHAGDKAAAADDTKTVQEDGKTFGKDFGEFVATSLADLIPGVGEALGAAVKVAQTAGKAAGDVAKGGGEIARDGAKGGGEVAGEVGSAIPKSSISDLKNKLQDELFGQDFVEQLTGIPKNATKEEKQEYVKQKINDQVNNVMQQLGFPQNGAPPSTQQGGSNDDLATLLAQLQTEVGNLPQPQPS